MSVTFKKPERPQVSPSESFQQLAQTASLLNAQTVRLAKVVDSLDEALKKLNLGVSAWILVTSWSTDLNDFDEEWFGYTKLKDKWGLAIKLVSGNLQHIDEASESILAFSDSKRETRIRAVKHIPDLLIELNKQAAMMTTSLAAETAAAEDIATMITGVSLSVKAGGK